MQHPSLLMQVNAFNPHFVAVNNSVISYFPPATIAAKVALRMAFYIDIFERTLMNSVPLNNFNQKQSISS
jgi:hypothetical protein